MRKRKKFLWALGILSGLLAGSVGGVYVWAHYGHGHSAPVIGLSISDVWYDRTQINPAPYAAALARVGAKVRDLRPSDDLDRALDGLEGLVLAGSHEDVDPRLYGGDPSTATGVNRARDDFEIELLRRAEAKGIPVLAICRGAQLLTVAYGGKLKPLEGEAAGRHGLTLRSFSAHDVRIEPSSRLGAKLGEGLHAVSSTHFKEIADPGPRLRVVAWAEDGVVEGVELPGDRFVLGIQWHPELEPQKGDRSVVPFRLVVEAARSR